MRAGPYTGLSQYQLNPQYPSPVQGGQAQLSHTVPQRHSSALWGQSISSDWCLLAFSIEITCESLVYPAEGKGSCAGAPHPKQTSITRLSDEAGQAFLTVPAGVISTAPDIGQEYEWSDV